MIFSWFLHVLYFFCNGFRSQVLIYVSNSYQNEETSEDLFVFLFLLKWKRFFSTWSSVWGVFAFCCRWNQAHSNSATPNNLTKITQEKAQIKQGHILHQWFNPNSWTKSILDFKLKTEPKAHTNKWSPNQPKL